MKSIILGVAASLLATGVLAAIAKAPPQDLALARDMLKEQIAINSVLPRGSTEAANALAARFRTGGFADVQVLAPADKPHKGNVVVRLKGTGKAKPVLWMCHLDVVEAKPEDWTQPPFQLTEKDGYLYGRGTSDVKGECVAVAESLIRLKREGYKPDRDIIAIFTADEESGDANGVDFLLKEHRPLIDAAFVMNPDGGGGALKNGKPLFFGVQ
ncbi:MAG: M20/M25/M40 family metallo-hydrolase, partial [Caulobacteraceae bacterium]